MTHAILVQNKVMAKDVDAFNRPAVCADALDNGNVVILATQDTSATYGQTEVWDATKPATGSLVGVWMVYEPEVVTTVSGTKKYKGIDPDPQDFYNAAGEIFSVYKPQLGDIILLTDDGITGTKGVNTFIVATDSDYKLNWASSAGAGLSYKLISTSYVSVGSGAIDSQRIVAYKFSCVVL